MIDIRAATPDDFLAIAELDRRAWLQNRRGEFIPDGEHVWRCWCQCAITLVATDGTGVVGAAVAFPCIDGRYMVHKIFVDRDRRGRGIGGRLLGSLLERLDQRRATAFLTVDPVNAAALALYERHGFCEREFVKGYYRPDEDRFVLTRPAFQE
ncbi:MAG: GNAT family N-acetyltransferase [Planctomycetes bacterium]|nr:GNAT family N-acetyltransferase [Planctomycetota bacterium]